MYVFTMKIIFRSKESTREHQKSCYTSKTNTDFQKIIFPLWEVHEII